MNQQNINKAADARVKLQHICKRYDRKQEVVSDINLEVYENEFLVMLGPSGCGKSTILRMIAGLEEISSGSLFLDGRHSNTIQPRKRDIAMVFQNYALYPHMTVYDNMAFGLKMRKHSHAEINRRVNEAANILSIENYLNRLPRMLSGGERQRVALGRAMVREPRVFLMDEPLSSLDAQLRIQMRAEILKLHQNAGSTFIYVTHDQTEAMTMGSRIVVLNNGRIQQADTPQRVYEYPENIFVAGFIGSPPMNLFNAEIHNNREGYFISFNGKHIRLKKEHCEAIARLRANINILTAGIRPEDVIISEQSDETLPCIVEIAEPAGHEMYLHLKSEKIAIVARIKNDYRIKPGQKIFISLNAEKLHLFNPADQRNILKHE